MRPQPSERLDWFSGGGIGADYINRFLGRKLFRIAYFALLKDFNGITARSHLLTFVSGTEKLAVRGWVVVYGFGSGESSWNDAKLEPNLPVGLG